MSKNKKTQQKKQRSLTVLWWTIGIAVAIGVIVLAATAPKRSPSSITTREVALTCTTDMATVYHIHPNLEIIINGVPQEIPASIGIKASCMNSLHTHDNSGQIHVEAPEKRDFTLADFFAVWDKPFDRTQLFDNKVDDRHVIRVSVNGIDVDTFEHTVLVDHDRIVISYEEKK